MDKNDQAAVSDERLAALILFCDEKDRSINLVEEDALDVIAALRELQRLRAVRQHAEAIVKRYHWYKDGMWEDSTPLPGDPRPTRGKWLSAEQYEAALPTLRRLAGREGELTGSCPSCGGKLNESREPMLYPCATLHYQDGSP